jgi:ribosomal protein S18 acetylase RimI-like enzyme
MSVKRHPAILPSIRSRSPAMTRLVKLQEPDAARFEAFIAGMDAEFEPSISRRVDLDAYARKLLQVGEVIAAMDDDQFIVGTIGFYCNDLENRCAYISLVGVSRRERRLGVGGALLDDCLQKCRSAGMVRVDLHLRASNRAALALYRSRGFQVETEARLSIDRIKLTLVLGP